MGFIAAAFRSHLFAGACALVGVDARLIADCPPRDRDTVGLLATLMILVWLWQSVVFGATAHLMLARAGEWRLDLIAAGALLAAIVLLVDACVVMRPSWTSLGHEELRRGGLRLRLPMLTRLKGTIFLGLRLTLAAVIGTLVALFVSLVLYGKDIDAQLAAVHAGRNNAVIAAATRQVDERLQGNATIQADLRDRLNAVDRAAEVLRRGLLDRADAVSAGAAIELARAEAARARAEAEVARRQRRTDDTGLARAREALATAVSEWNSARARLNEAQGRALMQGQGRDTTLAAQLTALDAQRRQDLDRLTRIEFEGNRLMDARPAIIRATVEANPAYSTLDDGLLARLRALSTLTADRWVLTVVLLLEAFFAGIELAAVFSKLLSFVPATYATRLAQEDHLRQAGAACQVAAALGTPTAGGVGGRAENAGPRSEVDLAGDDPLTTTPPRSVSAPVDLNRSLAAPPGIITGPSIDDVRQCLSAAHDADASSVLGSELMDPAPRRRRGRPPKIR